MSTEIDDLKMRVASLEDEFRAVFGKAETVEPAPGSDAEHPPVGYRLANGQEFVVRGALLWSDFGEWKEVLRSQCYGEEKAFQFTAPIANPIPANEGDSRVTESVAIPVGWVRNISMDPEEGKAWDRAKQKWVRGAGCDPLHCSAFIFPDPSIPWGEGYEAILPSEATEGNEYWSMDRWWKSGGGRCHPSVPGYFAWRRRIPATTPTEPARDLSADGTYWRDTAVKHFESLQKEQAKNALLRDQLTKMLEGMR